LSIEGIRTRWNIKSITITITTMRMIISMPAKRARLGMRMDIPMRTGTRM
jgi:hypothetical protein